jgi:hypothetical protein
LWYQKKKRNKTGKKWEERWWSCESLRVRKLFSLLVTVPQNSSSWLLERLPPDLTSFPGSPGISHQPRSFWEGLALACHWNLMMFQWPKGVVSKRYRKSFLQPPLKW